MFTVWYMCTPVACDYRYTLSTVRTLTPRAAAILARGFLIDIIVLQCTILLDSEIYFLYCFFQIICQHCCLRHDDGVCLWNLLKWSLS